MKYGWLVALAVSACSYDDQGETAVEVRDASSYAASVQPLLGPGCATLDCHGDPEQPLTLYSENGLRRSAALRGEPISQDELAANVLAIAGVDPGAQPTDHLVVRKPLSEEAGGMHHKGGDLWVDTSDPAYLCMTGWLSDDIEGISADCDAASAVFDR